MSNNPEPRTRFRYRLILWSCRLAGMLPDWFLYHCLLDVLYFLLYRVARYRVSITRENLSRSFPEKSVQELREIERKFYYNLAEVFIDTIDLAGISRADLEKRVVFTDLDEQRKRTAGRNWIAMMAHYGCWEYYNSYMLYDPDCVIAGAYHPLHNEAFDCFFKTLRSRFGMIPVPMHELPRYYIRHSEGIDGRSLILGLIADQNPPKTEHSHWYRFLGQPTIFFPGAEKLARRFHLPIYFLQIEKPARARYRLHFDEIYDGTEEVDEHEITARYVTKLEEMIRRRPELWMWSHKRWKHRPSAEAIANYNRRYGISEEAKA